MSAVPNARPVGMPASNPTPQSMSGSNAQPSSSSSNAGPAASSSSSAGATAGPPANVQEFVIRVPKNLKKHHHVMRFNATLNVDFAQWKMVKLERENNLKEFRGFDEDMPKFGAGSEYNRELREEVRRKKYGIVAKRYKPEAQPWILKVGGKSGKKFRGIREGGVGENAAFYVFAHAPDGAIEAYPLNEWYNFQPIQRYKALSAEEAEHEFGRRKKVMNYFSLMLRKRMKGDEEEPVDAEEAKANKSAAKKSKDLKISDMDEWIDSDEDSSSEDEDKEKPKKDEAEDSDDAAAKKKKKGKKGAPEKKKKKRDLDDEAFEESDDGDEEGRELDYISDSSDSEPDPESKANKEMKSVAEEDALRKLLTSDDDSDEEKKSGESEKDEAEAKKAKDKQEAKEAKEARDKHKKKKLKKKREDKKESSSELSSNSSDSDDSATGDGKSAATKSHSKNKKKNGSAPPPPNSHSRSASPVVSDSAGVGGGNKRKIPSLPTDLGTSDNSNSPTATPVKRPRTDHPASMSMAGPSSSMGGGGSSRGDDNGITEEAVRRYLMRKPMTTTELLTKFKNKKTGVSSEKLVETMTQILKKINPVKQTIQGKMYLSIKTK